MQKTFGPYSPICWAGDLGFISGQVGVDPVTKLAPADFAGQMRLVLANVAALLLEHNVRNNQIVKTTVFLTDMDDFTIMNELYQEFFAAPRPARSCVAVASLPKIADNELRVEIEAVVYRPSP